MHELKFGGDDTGRDVLEREESDDCSLFHGDPDCTNDVNFFENRISMHMDARTKTFKERIEVVEIISQKISFVRISGSHRVR
jgi:hypothetical protein